MTITTTTRTVQLGPERELCIRLRRGSTGAEPELILSLGYDDNVPGWRGHAATMALPAAALPEIRAALDALDARERWGNR